MDAHIVLAHSDVKRARVKFSNFKFSPVRGWVTSEVHETVGGLHTTVCSREYCLQSLTLSVEVVLSEAAVVVMRDAAFVVSLSVMLTYCHSWPG